MPREMRKQSSAHEAARAAHPHSHAAKLPETEALCYTRSVLSSHSLVAVLFDLGGVLVHLDYEAIAAEAGALSIPLDARALPRAEGAARRAIDARAGAIGAVPGTDATRVPDYFDDLLAAAGLALDARDALVPRLRAQHAESNLWRVPFADAAATLAALRRAGLRLAVVSNADGRAASVLEAAGLAADLDAVLDSHLEGVEKPNAEIFRRALARVGAPAERAVFVGDIVSIDIAGARNAGMRPILIDPARAYRDVAIERIERLTQLPAQLGIATEAAS
jgi:putative hydrolase of the HAD superfamily